MKTLIPCINTDTNTDTLACRSKDIAFRTLYAMLVVIRLSLLTVDVDDDVVYVDDENVDGIVDDFQAESLACGGWQKPHRGNLQWI